MTKRNDIIQFVLSLGIIILVAFLSTLAFSKFDLTQEKRHSLTDATHELLEGVDDVVYVKCYLHGEFPAKFKRLEQAVKERLDEFADYSDGLVKYTFIDPYESDDEKTQAETENALYEDGLRFTRLSYEENGVKKFKNIWPEAVIEYKGKSYPVHLFKSNNPDPQDAMINASINNLEYELASGLRMLCSQDKPRIGLLKGHGELDELEMIDFSTALEEYYFVEDITLNEKIYALSEKLDNMNYRINKYDAIVIAKPDSAFSKKDKLILDQFIMNGGKTLWLVDPILTDLDSLRRQQQTLGVSNEMGLYDMFFEYGVRLNRTMVIDYQCAPIAFDAGPSGNQRGMQLFNWYYAPVVVPHDTAHPIVNNLDPIKLEFTSSLDTVGENPLVKKTVLLSSSELSKELKAPIRISSSIVDFSLDYFKQNANPSSVAVLLEGEFNSNFTHRLPDTLKNDKDFAFRSTSSPTKMVVVADGDIARNGVMAGAEGPVPFPLGYDRYARRVVYDNKEFLLNTMNYLLDDDALISLRSRSIELRTLNADKVQSEKLLWQFINVVLPLMLVVVLGITMYFIRRKHSTSQSN